MHLVIANKLYSSWSLRPWLVLKAFDIPFEETVIPLRQDDTSEKIRVHSPTGKVPVLIDGDVRVWESLAIIEYLAEKFPDKAIWPRGAEAKSHARAISAEMLAGFQPLRQACPMNLGKRFAAKDWEDGVLANVARIELLWRETRQKFSGGRGDFLIGAFSAADAMYAPVASRLATYGFELEAETQAYMGAVFAHPAFVDWRQQAFEEPWVIEDYEEGHKTVEVLKT